MKFAKLKPIPDDLEGRTYFMNVDVEIASKVDLAPLVAALGKNVVTLHTVHIDRRYKVYLELTRSPKTASEAIARFVRLLNHLPRRTRNLWTHASVKDFNIGIQAGMEPRFTEFILDAGVLKEMVRLGGRLVFTVYQAEFQNKRRRKPASHA